MCYLCVEAAVAGATVLVGWRLWLHQFKNFWRKQ